MADYIKDVSRVEELLSIMDELTNFEIKVGIQANEDKTILQIAYVQEFGWTIRPKGQRLAIPLNKKAKEAGSPRNMNDLFPLKTDDGDLYLVREKGKGQLEFMYWLATEVTIPERSYIRGAYDKNIGKIDNKIDGLLEKVITGKLTVAQMKEQVGIFCVNIIQNYMTNLKDPANSAITLAAKSPKSNPLIDSGELRQKITYKVVKK